MHRNRKTRHCVSYTIFGIYRAGEAIGSAGRWDGKQRRRPEQGYKPIGQPPKRPWWALYEVFKAVPGAPQPCNGNCEQTQGKTRKGTCSDKAYVGGLKSVLGARGVGVVGLFFFYARGASGRTCTNLYRICGSFTSARARRFLGVTGTTVSRWVPLRPRARGASTSARARRF